MTIEKRDVTFKSADNLCSGWFFLPQRGNADKPVPAIAMAHGVGAVKEMYIDFFARRFAEAGIAALLFDYRFFGASGCNCDPRYKAKQRQSIFDFGTVDQNSGRVT
jgi:dipeptidyl aminopeptidase/acylaminoacyl peptidase